MEEEKEKLCRSVRSGRLGGSSGVEWCGVRVMYSVFV